MREILHVDLNNFYASVEMKINPSLKGKFVAVCGNVENRHGIILAKSENAKKLGVKTGMTIKDAQKLCPEIVLVEANHDKYIVYSKMVKKIYQDYTDYIEPFGIDECWLDVTQSKKLFGDGETIANLIRDRVKKEVGLTVSVGVSFNKVFAKLGSDMKKPDAVTVISFNNFKEKVWKLPVENLLFVGNSTRQKLNKINVMTIGDLANLEREYLLKTFGKWGETLHVYARGEDETPVLKDDESDGIKSVGNSITSYRDLCSDDDVKIIFTVLAESVSSRLKSYNIGKANTLSIYVRDNNLNSITRQCKLEVSTVLPEDFEKSAFTLFKKHVKPFTLIRTLGLTVSDFETFGQQITFDEEKRNKQIKLNDAVSKLNSKYSNGRVLKGILLKDKKLLKEDPKETHNVHPDGKL